MKGLMFLALTAFAVACSASTDFALVKYQDESLTNSTATGLAAYQEIFADEMAQKAEKSEFQVAVAEVPQRVEAKARFVEIVSARKIPVKDYRDFKQRQLRYIPKLLQT